MMNEKEKRKLISLAKIVETISVNLLFFIMTLLIAGLSVPETSFAGSALSNEGMQERIRQQAIKDLQRQRQRGGSNRGGRSRGYGGNQGYEKWYAFCNKSGTSYNRQNAGRIHIGKQKPQSNNYVWVSTYGLNRSYNSEPAVRSAVNRYCSSWQCNWNGACVTARTGGGGGGDECLGGGTFGQGSCR